MKIQKYKCMKNMLKFNEHVKQLKEKYYLGNKISQQLPYKRYEKLHFLHTSLAVAYDIYAKEQMKLGFKVLSESSVYRCLKGIFHIRKKYHSKTLNVQIV